MAPTRHTALAALAALLLPGVCARRRPDLGVSITQDGPQLISDFTRFEVAVRNLGNRRVDAGDAEITITLPTTNTSPNVHVLGELGSKSSACALTASGLGYVCSLPRIDKAGGANDVATLFFELKVPQSSAQIEIVAELSKVPRREVTPANNRGTIVPEQLFTSPAVNPPSPRTVVLRHCTGQDLTSFFECEASPSSISTHTAYWKDDGSITTDDPNTSGAWTQAGTGLTFTYSNAGGVVASFTGAGVSTLCFNGLTTFPGSVWVSPYEVCLA